MVNSILTARRKVLRSRQKSIEITKKSEGEISCKTCKEEKQDKTGEDKTKLVQVQETNRDRNDGAGVMSDKRHTCNYTKCYC